MADETMAHLQEVWEAQAVADPLWAILSEDSRRRRGWDLESFLASGESFVVQMLSRFADLGYRPSGSALDFGCGVGRLTQPLAARFDRVIGVDISPTMVEAAMRLNRFGDRVSYVVNAEPNLSFVPSASVEMVNSFITLQHIPPAAASSYLIEMIRIIRPGGVLFFQLPSHRNAELVEMAAAVEPVRPEHCVAHLEVSKPPETVVARESAQVTVRVRNESQQTWISTPDHPLRLANHWVDPIGNTLVQDDGRTGLPSRIAGSETVEAVLTVTAPDEPGSYGLALDVVQEGVRWFGDVGNSPVVVPIQVVAPDLHEGSVPTSDLPAMSALEALDGLIDPEWHEPPAFSMHGMKRGAVERLLTDNGAVVLATDEHVDDWVSYSYFVAVSARTPKRSDGT